MLRIQIAGVTIWGAPYDSARLSGLYVGPDGFEGWEDGGGDSRRDSVDRPAQHGEFDLPVSLGSRVITVDGYALAASAIELGHLRNAVMGVCAAGGRARLTIDHQEQTLWAHVRRGAKPTFKDAGIRHGVHRGRFMLSMLAADPRKYGETREFAAGVAAVHYGNFPATPVHEVTGTGSGYTITGPAGRAFTVSSGPGSGVDRIDMASGRVYRNGALLLGAVSRADLWTIPPGAPGVTHAISAGTLTTTVTDTFV